MLEAAEDCSPEREGHKETKIGLLPTGWDVVSLEEITEPRAPIRYGVVQIGPDTPGGVPIVPIKHIRRIRDVVLHRVSPKIEGQYKGSRVQGGDVLLSVKGTIGEVGVVPDGFEGNIAREIARVRPKPCCDAQFLSLQIQAPQTKRRIDNLVVGSTRLEFSIHAVRDFMVALPPLPEQRKIAEILRTWDEALEKLTALRVAKLKRHRGLTMALVFGGWQLERFRKTNEVTPYRWFELPGSWSCQHIGDLATEISERNGEGGQHEVLSCSKHDGFVRSLEYFKKQVFSADLTGYKKIWRGDFGFPSNHVEEGSIGLQNLTDIGVVSPIYTVFRFTPDKVNAEYAFSVLKTELYRHIFEVSTSASVDRRGSLRWTEFSRLPFPVPPLDEQEAIADVLRTSRSELDALTDEIEAVSRQKRGLMQKLLTGEWRVNSEKVLA